MGAEGADDESSNNLAAVRQYGFTEIVDLQDTMLRLQKAIGESNVEVEALKRQVSSAMQQRNVLLGLQSKAQLDDAAAAKEAQAEEARRAAAERKAKLSSSSSSTKKKKKMGMKGSSSSSSRSSGGGGGGGGGVGAKKRRKKRGSPSGNGGALAMYRPAGKAGDVVYWHPRLVHSPGINRTGTTAKRRGAVGQLATLTIIPPKKNKLPGT